MPLLKHDRQFEAEHRNPRIRPDFPCPGCGSPGHTDIHDRLSGRRHLSCTQCFKMGQVKEEPSLRPLHPIVLR